MIDKEAALGGLTASWTYDAVYNVLRDKAGPKLDDASGLIEWLEERRREAAHLAICPCCARPLEKVDGKDKAHMSYSL